MTGVGAGPSANSQLRFGVRRFDYPGRRFACPGLLVRRLTAAATGSIPSRRRKSAEQSVAPRRQWADRPRVHYVHRRARQIIGLKAPRSGALMVAVGFNPQAACSPTPSVPARRWNASITGFQASLRDAMCFWALRPPWAEAHGYRQAVAARRSGQHARRSIGASPHSVAADVSRRMKAPSVLSGPPPDGGGYGCPVSVFGPLNSMLHVPCARLHARSSKGDGACAQVARASGRCRCSARKKSTIRE